MVKDRKWLNLNPLNILRFRAKTMPKIKGKWQGVPIWHPLERDRVNDPSLT